MIKIVEEISWDNRMAPDEGYSHGSGLGRIEPFIYLEDGIKGSKYQAAFIVEIAGQKITFVDDEIFDNYSPAGKKSYILVKDFMMKLKVVFELIVIPNIKSLDESE